LVGEFFEGGGNGFQIIASTIQYLPAGNPDARRNRRKFLDIFLGLRRRRPKKKRLCENPKLPNIFNPRLNYIRQPRRSPLRELLLRCDHKIYRLDVRKFGRHATAQHGGGGAMLEMAWE
jgi:hypothetical protein